MHIYMKLGVVMVNLEVFTIKKVKGKKKTINRLFYL